jgi:hypothetical protein
MLHLHPSFHQLVLVKQLVRIVILHLLHVTSSNHVKIMVLVLILTQIFLVIIVHVHLFLMVHNVNLIIDHVSQLLVGIMVSFIFLYNLTYMVSFEVHVIKHQIQHLNVYVKMDGKVRIVKQW